MKNIKWLTIMMLVFILAACGAEENLQPASQPEENPTEEVEEVEEEPEPVVEPEEPVEEVVVQPEYELNEANWTIRPISSASSKVVLLTIDDAPDKRSLEMAKTLKALDAPAIFFVNGHFLDTEEEKAMLKEIHEMGFAIGNHTQTHANLKQLSEEEQRAEIMSLNETIVEVIGEKPKFFRAPFGVNTDFTRELVRNEGMLLMNWTYGYDWEKDYQEANALADIMVNTEYLTDGANLLMHDRVWTAAALKPIVEGLRAKGYEMVDPSLIQGVNVD